MEKDNKLGTHAWHRMDQLHVGVSSRCSSPAGITRVELGLERPWLNPRLPRSKP
jgi:hypothetical protein